MKKFEEVAFDFPLCRRQFDEFRDLLEKRVDLGETADVLPFFRDRQQLAVLLGTLNPRIGWADRIAYEFDVFGDFACDLAIGEWASGSYCFIEFEDAQQDSVFKRQGKKATREWSNRFDHGFSQIVDWCHKLNDRTNSADFVSRFGRYSINFEAVLVIGRDSYLDEGERLRLDWRTEHVRVNSKKVHCLTFDQLLGQLSTRLSALTAVAQTAGTAEVVPPSDPLPDRPGTSSEFPTPPDKE